MTKHTPGPWKTNITRLSDNSIYVSHVLGPKGQGLAQIGIYGEEETLANASLIAAAPDMLEALQAVVAVADRKTVEFDLARAAIAKAMAHRGGE